MEQLERVSTTRLSIRNKLTIQLFFFICIILFSLILVSFFSSAPPPFFLFKLFYFICTGLSSYGETIIYCYRGLSSLLYACLKTHTYTCLFVCKRLSVLADPITRFSRTRSLTSFKSFVHRSCRFILFFLYISFFLVH